MKIRPIRQRGTSLLTLLAASTLLAGCDLIGLGCGGEDRPVYEPEYGGGEGIDVGSLTYQTFALFQSLDIPSEMGPEVETGFFEALAREIKVEGSPVFFLEYQSEEEASEVASKIASDGRAVDGKEIPMKGVMSGTPHFYRSGKVIAFYFGDREKTMQALETVVGGEFAGGGRATQDGEVVDQES